MYVLGVHRRYICPCLSIVIIITKMRMVIITILIMIIIIVITTSVTSLMVNEQMLKCNHYVYCQHYISSAKHALRVHEHTYTQVPYPDHVGDCWHVGNGGRY